MGLCNSVPQWHENWKEVKDICRRLEIHKSEAKRLYRAFKKADQAEAGTIVLSDLLAIAGIEESRAGFARRVFGAMDSNSDGDLDFAEMIVAIWNLCSLSDEKLMDFVRGCAGARPAVGITRFPPWPRPRSFSSTTSTRTRLLCASPAHTSAPRPPQGSFPSGHNCWAIAARVCRTTR